MTVVIWNNIRTTDRWEFFNWLCNYPLGNTLEVLHQFENGLARTVTNDLMDVKIRFSKAVGRNGEITYYGTETLK